MPGDERETTLQEILRSPLDDMPPRSTPSWLPLVVWFVVVVVAGFLLISWLGGDEASVATTVAVEGAGAEDTTVPGGAPGTTAGSGATTVPATVPGPEPATVPPTLVGAEAVATDDGVALVGGFTPAGGIGRDPVLDTYLLDVDDGTVSSVVGPAPLLWHRAVHLPDRDAVLVFGGGNTEFRRCNRFRNLCPGSDTDLMWLLDLSTGGWSRVEAANQGPGPRFGHVMVHHPPTGLLVLYGGGAVPDRVTGTFFSDTWVLDLDSFEWEQRADGPGGRVHAAAAFHPATGTIAVYGGDTGTVTAEATLWGYDVDADEWIVLDDGGEPRARWLAEMVVLPETGDLLLVGGAGPRETAIEGGTSLEIVGLDDVWVWSDGWEARNAIPEDVDGWIVANAEQVISVGRGELFVYDAATDEWRRR